MHSHACISLQVWDSYRAGKAVQMIDASIYKENVKDEILRVIEIGLSCTQADPRSRPTMARVVELLRSKRSEEEKLVLTDPPFLEISIDSMQR